MTDNSKFFVKARADGYYEGTIQLPSGTRYAGRIYPNPRKDDEGFWYRGDLKAMTPAAFNADANIDPTVKPEGLAADSTLKPCELRLNPWKDGSASHIGKLWTSEGLFTVFANEITHNGEPALAGSIKPARVAAEPDASAARDNASARVAGGKPLTPEA